MSNKTDFCCDSLPNAIELPRRGEGEKKFSFLPPVCATHGSRKNWNTHPDCRLKGGTFFFNFLVISSPFYFLKIKKIAENKLFCVCALLTERQHTCDKQKHKIMILTIVFPPEVGERATASHNFIICTNWMQIKRWWNHEKIEKECSPLQSTVGMSIPIFTWPVSSAHRGEKWKSFLSFPPAWQLNCVR